MHVAERAPTNWRWESDLRSSAHGFWLALAIVAVANAAAAEVFASKREALEQAFPTADAIEQQTLVLDDDRARAIEKRSHGELESRLATIHTAERDGRIIGHAIIDVHTVRTFPEAFMVVLSPDGEVVGTRILAFYEPSEYMPSERWLAQFDERRLEPSLSLGGDIHGIAGATLSSRAVTTGVRRALALYEAFLGTPAVAAAPPVRKPSAGLAAGGQ
jgi:hypothetical protein